MPDINPDAAELDGTDATIDVKYGDNVYRFPASLDQAPYAVIRAIDAEKFSRALDQLMSPEDLAKFDATRPTIHDATQLFDAYARQIGLTSAGE
jgi:hypothetical protein